MDSSLSTILIGLGTPVAMAIAALLTWLTSRRTSKSTEMTAKADAEEKASDSWKELYVEVRSEQRLLQDRMAAMEMSLREQAEREFNTRQDLDRVYTWIEGGMRPPIPSRPLYLTREVPRNNPQ